MSSFRVRFESEVADFQKRVDRRDLRALYRTAGYTRTTIARSFRRAPKRGKRKTSKPGNPPFSHVGTLKRLTKFKVDRKAKAFVAGPEIFEGKNKTNEPVPKILNEGGTIKVVSGKKKQTFRIAARPFVAPAREKAAERLMTNLATIPL